MEEEKNFLELVELKKEAINHEKKATSIMKNQNNLKKNR